MRYKPALSLDTIRLKWNIQRIPATKKPSIEPPIAVSESKIIAASKNQLKKRRPRRKRR